MIQARQPPLLTLFSQDQRDIRRAAGQSPQALSLREASAESPATPELRVGGGGNGTASSDLDATSLKPAEHDLHERAKVAQFTAEVNNALTGEEPLSAILQLCCEAMVEHLEVTCARVWTLNGTQSLDLESTAATGVDEAPLALGKLDVGLIAVERKPYLTNSAAGDTRVSDQKWVKRERIVAIAGHPLLVNEQLVGVMLIFARKALSDLISDALAAAAKSIALGIRRKRTEDALKEALRRAEESSRLKSAFLANMSHEIRTPLNVILGFGELLCEDVSTFGGEARPELIEGIRRASERLANTVDGMLDLAKVQASSFEIRPEAIQLGPFLHEQVERFRKRAAEQSLALSCEVEDPDAVAVFDKNCLSKILHQLLDNALKFTAQGQVSVVLRRDRQGSLTLEVRDSGVGIDKSYMLGLFNPFSQERSGYTRPFEGSGIGLALVKGLVELNGAKITVESKSNKGTTFTIRFAITNDPRSVACSETQVAASADAVTRRTVLIVEDEPDNQLFMRTILGKLYPVLTASSGAELRSTLSSHGSEIGIVLMDLSLRGSEDGLELTRYIREHAEHADVPVVATTAHAFEEDRSNAFRAGCNAFLEKPFTRGALLSVVETFLPKPIH